MDPADEGAVAVMVKAAVPGGAADASALVKLTVQVSSAPVEFRLVQLTDETPVPAVAAVAMTPDGS